MIDGRQCLVIAVDDHIEVNGINVRTIKRPANGEYNGSAEKEPYGGDAEKAEYGGSAGSVEEGGYAGSVGNLEHDGSAEAEA